MKDLEKHLNRCYLEYGKEYIFVYKFIKVEGRYGLLCSEAQVDPCQVWIYEDFPDDQEGSVGFLESFIPDLNPECEAKEISKGHYLELVSKLEALKIAHDTVNSRIRNFVKTHELE